METKNISKTDFNKLVYNFLKNHLKSKNDYDKEYITSMGKSYELIFEAYTVLGEKELLTTGFKEEVIKRAIHLCFMESRQVNKRKT